jgi:hypothetical protein
MAQLDARFSCVERTGLWPIAEVAALTITSSRTALVL